MLSDSLQSLIPAARQQESDLAAAQAAVTSQNGTIGAQQQQIKSLSDQLTATQQKADGLTAQLAAAKAAPAPAPQIVVGTSYIAPADFSAKLADPHLPDGASMVIGADTYPVNGSPTIKAKGLKVYGPGRIVLTPALGASSGIVIQGDGCEFSGMTVAGPCVAFRVYGTQGAPIRAGVKFSRVTFDASLAVGMILDAWSNLTEIFGCEFGIIGGCGVYCTSDGLRIYDSIFHGSQGEHCVRFDVSSTGHIPIGARIDHCAISNHNPAGKETVTARQLLADPETGVGLEMTDTILDGWASFGEAGNQNHGQVYTSGVVLRRVTFASLRPGGALIQQNYNVDLLCDACAFPASATETAISANGGAKLSLTNNVMLVPAGMTPKPLAAANPASDPSIVISETGTNRRAA